MDYKDLLWLIFFCTCFPEIVSVNCNIERRCKTSNIHGLKTSDCYGMDLKEFPKCLASNIEVLELTYNRIRKLSSEDLQRYPHVTHLYLMDNLIVNIDEEVVKDLTNLETLDLSINALGKVPPAIFQLPYLKTLYLSQNMNINIAESIEEAKPISQSSLTKLDISYITKDGGSTDFPDFGELPLLAFLNITGDQFNEISTKHFAGLCNLQILASANVTADYNSGCDCWKINQWLTERNVRFAALPCSIQENDCQNDKLIDEEDLEIFKRCQEKFQQIKKAALLKKVGLWTGGVLVVLLLVAAIFGYRKLTRSRQQKRDLKMNVLRERDQHHLLNNQSKV